MGDARLTEHEREEIANSSDFKEAADWLIAPGESLLLTADGDSAQISSEPACLPPLETRAWEKTATQMRSRMRLSA